MQGTQYSPERVSVAIGVCIVMLSVLPRYITAGYGTHQTLLLIALAVVVGATLFQWSLLTPSGRQKISSLLKRLALMLVIGSAIMGAWHGVFTDWISWQEFLSHATTCGLLLHAISLGWTRR